MDPDAPIRSEEQLGEFFRAAERPRDRWRVGVEAERFGVDARTGAPLDYDAVARLLQRIAQCGGGEPLREMPGGPLLGLRQGAAALTLEPGAQLELSSAPATDLHVLRAQMRALAQEVEAASPDLAWLATGFHPLAARSDLPWVPKQRYALMRDYFPRRGRRGLDMMQRTASLQVSVDYASEADALRKLRLLLRLSPLLGAMFANAPFCEGRRPGPKSLRGEVWLDVDPDRTGLVPAVLQAPRPTYRDYVQWALDVPMFHYWRGGAAVANTGQTFRSFFREGHGGHRATLGDWQLHLNTLFPEVRLRTTLEVRCIDALPEPLWPAAPALLVGILDAEPGLEAAEALLAPFDHAALATARPSLARDGLAAAIGGVPARGLAECLLAIGLRGLDARGRGEGELLAPLGPLVAAGRSPADVATEGLVAPSREALVARTQT